jgi:hypothetical protein
MGNDNHRISLQAAVLATGAKVAEINDSETVKNFKAKTAEVTTPYIDKGIQAYGDAREKAAPMIQNIWDRTVEVSSNGYEAAKPTLEKVSTMKIPVRLIHMYNNLIIL